MGVSTIVVGAPMSMPGYRGCALGDASARFAPPGPWDIGSWLTPKPGIAALRGGLDASAFVAPPPEVTPARPSGGKTLQNVQNPA